MPYRQTKLTAVLQDGLGGNSRTCLLLTIWPEKRHVEETLASLRFAQRLCTVTTNAVVNESGNLELQVNRLHRIIKELRSELLMRDSLM